MTSEKKDVGEIGKLPVSDMDIRTHLAGQAPSMPPDMIRLAQEHADCDSLEKTHREKCKVLADIWASWATMHADALLARLQED